MFAPQPRWRRRPWNLLYTQRSQYAIFSIDGFKSLLAGGEYTDVLNIVANDVEKLQLIDGYQREYLAEVKRYKELPAGERNSEEMAASEDSWFESVSLFLILTIKGKTPISSNIYTSKPRLHISYSSHIKLLLDYWE